MGVKANFEEPEDIDLYQSVISNTLSPTARVEGSIKVTLNEVIRFMIALKFKLSFINRVCKELTLLHNIDEGLAYAVFRDTEDEFTTRYYGHRYRKIKKNPNFPNQNFKHFFVLQKVIDFLELEDMTEMVFLNKDIHIRIKRDVAKSILRREEHLSSSRRVHLWWMLLDWKSFSKKMDTLNPRIDRKDKLYVIVKDLDRSV